MVRSARRHGFRWTMGLAAVALVVSACGGSSSGKSAQVVSGGAPTSPSSPAAAAVALTTHKGPLGTFLTDAAGRSLYLFKADTSGTSTCYGACASSWPPLTGPGARVSGSATAAKTGTTTRTDGATQITYAGHPLYYYAGDSKPGDTNGEGLDVNGGEWYLVTPAGEELEKPAFSSSLLSTQTGWV